MVRAADEPTTKPGRDLDYGQGSRLKMRTLVRGQIVELNTIYVSKLLPTIV